MVGTPIYCFSALKGKYLDLATSSYPIEAEGYVIHLDFISFVRELNFAGGFDKNSYKHVQDFGEICATLMISGMNHETLKWKTFPFSLTGWAKQWHKLHVSGCHSSWVVLKDQFCFAFFPLSKLLISEMRSSILLRRKERVWEQPGLDIISLPCQVQSYLFQMPCSCNILCTGWVHSLQNIWI
jgi:hypothetical protein